MGVPAQGDYQWHIARAWEQLQLRGGESALPEILHIDDAVHLFPVPNTFLSFTRLQLAPGGKFKEGGDWFCHKHTFISLLRLASGEITQTTLYPLNDWAKGELTIPETAKYLRKNETTIAKWVKWNALKYKSEIRGGQNIIIISRQCVNDVICRRSPLEVIFRYAHVTRCPYWLERLLPSARRV